VNRYIRRLQRTGWAVIISLIALACSGPLLAEELAEELAQMGAAKGENHVVIIKDLLFIPDKLQVKIGDTITWTNNDFIPHTATAMDKSWDSKNLAKGESFSLVVDENTLLEYFCVYHPNMVATIELSGDG